MGLWNSYREVWPYGQGQSKQFRDIAGSLDHRRVFLANLLLVFRRMAEIHRPKGCPKWLLLSLTCCCTVQSKRKQQEM